MISSLIRACFNISSSLARHHSINLWLMIMYITLSTLLRPITLCTGFRVGLRDFPRLMLSIISSNALLKSSLKFPPCSFTGTFNSAFDRNKALYTSHTQISVVNQDENGEEQTAIPPILCCIWGQLSTLWKFGKKSHEKCRRSCCGNNRSVKVLWKSHKKWGRSCKQTP